MKKKRRDQNKFKKAYSQKNNIKTAIYQIPREEFKKENKCPFKCYLEQ